VNSLKAKLKSYFKKLFSDLHSAIVGIIIAAVLLSLGGIRIFYENLWAYLKAKSQLPTPIWVTLSFVIVVLAYIYLKDNRNHSSVKKTAVDPIDWTA
jgi:hypothetical protein